MVFAFYIFIETILPFQGQWKCTLRLPWSPRYTLMLWTFSSFPWCWGQAFLQMSLYTLMPKHLLGFWAEDNGPHIQMLHLFSTDQQWPSQRCEKWPCTVQDDKIEQNTGSPEFWPAFAESKVEAGMLACLRDSPLPKLKMAKKKKKGVGGKATFKINFMLQIF